MARAAAKVPLRLRGLSPLARYGIAVGAAAIATAARLGLEPQWGLKLPFIFFFPAVMVSGLLGGWWPGITTTLLAATAAAYYWLPPARSWTIAEPADALGLLIFVGVGVLISALDEAWRRGTERVVASDERLRVTLRSIGDAVITTDEQGRVRGMNRLAEELTGWHETEAVGRSLDEVFVIRDEASRRPAENPVHRVLRDGRVTALANHTLLVARDGHETAIDDSASPIQAAGGSVIGVVFVFRDVTVRRHAERERERLYAAERASRVEAEAIARQLRLAVEAGRMGTWEYALGTGQVRWSPELETIHGLAPGGFPGTLEAFAAEIHPGDRERVLAAIGEAFDKQHDHHVEYRIVRTDGAVRWVEGRGQLVLDDEGRPARMVGVCSDVTDRKNEEERFQLALEASPAAMLILDQQGVVVFANALAEQLLGYERSVLCGLAVEALVPPRFREQHPHHRRGFMGDLQRRPMGAGRDLFALRKDGAEVPVEIGLSPFSTTEGVFVLAAISDITERKRAEQRRTELLAAEQEEARRKDEFLATLSHELRNPLAPIRHAVHFLASKGSAEPDLQAAHAIIDRQLHHLVRLVDDLLDLGRIAQDRLELHQERLPLAMVLESALEASRPLIEERRHELIVTLPPESLWVDADLIRLAQVFTNLGDKVVVHVRDNGEGMTTETTARLFEMFYQGAPAEGRTRTGLGIGLALSHRLVRMHGGTLEARSDGRGLGSELIVAVPAAVAPVDWAPEVAPSVEDTVSRRILVADDNPDAVEMLATLLRLEGHDVRTAADGLQACAVAADFRPDVALLDIGMPGVDGYEAARRIRRQPGGSDVLLIALTGWGQAEDRRRAEEAGFSMQVTKPVDAVKLRRLLSLPRS